MITALHEKWLYDKRSIWWEDYIIKRLYNEGIK